MPSRKLRRLTCSGWTPNPSIAGWPSPAANKPIIQLNAEIASRFARMSKEDKYSQIKLAEGVKPKRRYWDENGTASENQVALKQEDAHSPRKPKKSHQIFQ